MDESESGLTSTESQIFFLSTFLKCLGLVLAKEHMIQNDTHKWDEGQRQLKDHFSLFCIYIENGHMLPTRQRYAPQVVIRKSLIGYMLHTAVSTACEISKTFLGFQTR